MKTKEGYLILSFNRSCLIFFSKFIWKTCQEQKTARAKREKSKHCFVDQLLYFCDFRSRSLKAAILLTSWKNNIIHAFKKTHERHMDLHREKPVRCKDSILIKHSLQNFGSLTLEQLENSLPDKKG